MKIVEEIHSEDCFDGNFIKEYILDEVVTKAWVDFLKDFGRVTFLDGLAQPFYSFDKKYFFTIKGLLDDTKIKVIYRRNTMDMTAEFLQVLLDAFSKTGADRSSAKKLERDLLDKIEKGENL